MTQDQYVIRRKLNILELGETLGNISEACRRLNISRQHHYDIKSAVAEEGVEGLLEKSRTSVQRWSYIVGQNYGKVKLQLIDVMPLLYFYKGHAPCKFLPYCKPHPVFVH